MGDSEADVEHGDKDDGPIMKQPKFKDDLKVYVAMILITLAATGITLAKIKAVEAASPVKHHVQWRWLPTRGLGLFSFGGQNQRPSKSVSANLGHTPMDGAHCSTNTPDNTR